MAIDSKILAKLKNFNKNFAKQKKRADELGGFTEIPDGKYRAKVASCDLRNSNAGEAHLVFIFEITDSAEDDSLIGSKASKWCNIEKEDGIPYLIKDLRKFGVELEDLEQLPEIAELINNQKPELKISLKTGPSGQFSYIDQVTSEIDAGDHATTGEEDDSDEEVEEDSEDSEDSEETEVTEESDESEEETETEDEDVQLEVGTAVTFTSKKGEIINGEITVLNEEDSTVDIKSGTRSFKGIAVDRLTLAETKTAEEEQEEETEEEEEEEKQVKKPAKAAAKKPEPKKVTPAKKSTPAKKTVTKKRK